MTTIKTLTREYEIREENGEFWLYNTTTGQSESDMMETVEEVEDWFNQCAPWYAVQETTEDDWGTGSHDLEEAKEMADRLGYDIIAVIVNDVCERELHREYDFAE